jgi:hypothetical protein
MQKTIVEDDEVLYRRVQAGRKLKVPQPDGTFRLSSQAFGDPHYRLSVNRAKLCDSDPSKVQLTSTDGVVSVVTRDVRAIDSVVLYEKNRAVQLYNIDVEHVPEQDNYAHAEIFMSPSTKSQGVFRRLQERLAQMATWEIELQE